MKTETSKMHKLTSQSNLPSKYKESTPSYLDFSSSWVSTEVYYTATIYDKPRKEELKLTGNSQKVFTGKMGGKIY